MVRKATMQDMERIFELVKDFAASFNPQKELFVQSYKDMLNDKKAFIMWAVAVVVPIFYSGKWRIDMI